VRGLLQHLGHLLKESCGGELAVLAVLLASCMAADGALQRIQSM